LLGNPTTELIEPAMPSMQMGVNTNQISFSLIIPKVTYSYQLLYNLSG